MSGTNKTPQEKLNEISKTLSNMGINKPKTLPLIVFYLCILAVVALAFCLLYKLSVISELHYSCNNILVLKVLCMGFAAFIVYVVIRAFVKIYMISSDQYNKEFDTYDFYRKAMVERYIKEEDVQR